MSRDPYEWVQNFYCDEYVDVEEEDEETLLESVILDVVAFLLVVALYSAAFALAVWLFF